MAVKLECDRCKTQVEVKADSSVGAVVRNASLPAGWGTVQIAKFNQIGKVQYICDDCRGDLIRFMLGNEIPRKDMPYDRVIVLQHEPSADCEFAWDPELRGRRGGLMCKHDDVHRFDYLIRQSGVNAVHVVMAENEPAMIIKSAGTDGDEIDDEDPACNKCSHAAHRADACDGIVKTKKLGGTMVCPCRADLAVGPSCRLCNHSEHGTSRCMWLTPAQGYCSCVGALEDQLRNVPSQRLSSGADESGRNGRDE